jgi:anthranilate synthase component II
MKILLLDNYDSFTYNLLHYLEKIEEVKVSVILNDEIELSTIENFDAIVLSPGPGLPNEAGKLLKVIEKAIECDKPILGVCLGMQALASHFAVELYNQENVKHGVSEVCKISEHSSVFKDIPSTIHVGLYHSWAVNNELNSELIPLAFSENNVLMAMQHKSKRIYGFQFHPESILTEYGNKMIENFVILAK